MLRLLKRWAFWLPAPYVVFVCLAFLDIQFRISGDGEANAGAWMMLFAVLPGAMVTHGLGLSAAFPPSNATVAAIFVAQALLLFLVGALIDHARRRAPEAR